MHIFSNFKHEKIQHQSAKNFQTKFLSFESVNIILPKLDRETRKQFEYTLGNIEVLQFDDLIQFLENKSTILQSINYASHSVKNLNKNSPFI